MPKLVQINVASNYGSTGRIAESVGLLAKAKGWDVWVVHGPRYANPSGLNTKCTQSALADKIHGVESWIFDRHGLGSRCATAKLVKWLMEYKPDVVHLHNIHGYYINYPILFDYLKESNVKVVWTLHDCWTFTGHCSHFDFIGCDKWKTGCFGCPQLHTYPKAWKIDNSKRNFELKKKYFTAIKDNLLLVPVSEWLNGLLKDSFLSDCKSRVIHNGIDTKTFDVVSSAEQYFDRFGLDASKKIILGVTNMWSDRKGLADFVKLNDIIDKTKYQILLVGLTKEQIAQLPAGIIGIERTDSVQQLAGLYSLASVFFNPTWEDNFPTTNLEAMACGTPIITYRTGGSPEAVVEGVNGNVVPQGDLNAAYACIEKICAEGKEKYQDVCRKYAVDNFTREDRFMDYIELYEEILLPLGVSIVASRRSKV